MLAGDTLDVGRPRAAGAIRVVVCHNHYRQRSGEDQVFHSESELLGRAGNSVGTYTIDNANIGNEARLALATKAIWNRRAYRDLRDLLRSSAATVLHCQNTFPLISPAAYYAARAEGVAVVQTLHNYRVMCVAGTLFRDGHPCESCTGRVFPWPGIWHACYRGSRGASAAAGGSLSIHRWVGTWRARVDLYIAMSRSSREKFIAAGLPGRKIVVKPHFVHPDPGVGSGEGNYVLFVGRLSPEKGISTLLAAARALGPSITVKIAGDGPMAATVRQQVGAMPWVEWLGQRSRSDVDALIGAAKVVVIPSEWPETFGLIAIEAFARGTPVVAARIGAIAEVVENGRTGLHFTPGEPEDLAIKLGWLYSHGSELDGMRAAARAEYESKYTAEKNYAMLAEIYRVAAEPRG